MKLYTKKGDDGSTGLAGGGRVRKCDLRVNAYGEVDEANSAIGLAAGVCEDRSTVDILRVIQSDLFTLGAELATVNNRTLKTCISEDHVHRLELWIDEASAAVPAMKCFILPGGTELAGRLHLARTICRRAERAAVSLSDTQKIRHEAMIYLNRLSDLLFALARSANARAGVSDIPWRSSDGAHESNSSPDPS